jgi:hypothetical protein
LPNKLDLHIAEDCRLEVTAEQQRDIERMYRDISRDIGKKASQLPNTTSGRLEQWYLNDLQRQINEELEGLGKSLENTIATNMGKVAAAMVDSNKDFLREIHMPVQGAFSHVPTDIIKSILSGQVSDGNWSLRSSIWSHTQKTQEDISKIIAAGVARNRSAYDIAKDL